MIRSTCILDCDSPSYPPTDEEMLQCMCKLCIADLAKKGYLLGHYGRPENSEEDECMCPSCITGIPGLEGDKH